jgi:hypothetical protein
MSQKILIYKRINGYQMQINVEVKIGYLGQAIMAKFEYLTYCVTLNYASF